MEKLTTRERLMIGGLGALTPVIANLLVVDIQHVLSHAELFSMIGYVIRVGVLFGVGVIVAYLHDDETNKVKMFQFGMAAPAMLLATMNGSQIASEAKETQAQAQIVAAVSPADDDQEEPDVGPPAPRKAKPAPVVETAPVVEVPPAPLAPPASASGSPDASHAAAQQFMHGLILQQQQAAPPIHQ